MGLNVWCGLSVTTPGVGAGVGHANVLSEGGQQPLSPKGPGHRQRARDHSPFSPDAPVALFAAAMAALSTPQTAAREPSSEKPTESTDFSFPRQPAVELQTSVWPGNGRVR